jgi:L-serine dehydratase
MQSLRELYKIGRGPSSSHTIGPERICLYVKSRFPGSEYSFRVDLYGSLAMTGQGHGTAVVVAKTLGSNCEVKFDPAKKDIPHPNTMDITVFKDGQEIKTIRGMSIGGGSFKIENEDYTEPAEVYSLNSFEKISNYCDLRKLRLCDYVYEVEPDIKDYLRTVWSTMRRSVEEGLSNDGILPGGLDLPKRARQLFNAPNVPGFENSEQYKMLCAYSYAVCEQNADNGVVVTAPTCGASGVLPSVLYYAMRDENFTEDRIIDALATAGIIGNLIKTNASISGAECGCQAEVGSACCMAAAAFGELYRLSVDQIECAAEVAMEHSLGLTCDPVKGLVQVPCIERNAIAAIRALNSFFIAFYFSGKRRIKFDTIVRTMYETGKDMNSKYLETATGGIALNFENQDRRSQTL